MENKSHAFAAGAFVLVVVALLVTLAAWLSRDTSEQRVFELSSREGVTGLSPQAGVRYKGVSVGRVTSIGLDPKMPGNVLVRIAINEQAPITRSTFGSLGFQGVTGLAFVQLDDTGESAEPLLPDNGAYARIPMRQGMMSRLSDQGASLLTQLEQASQRVNQLLSPENQKNLMGAIGGIGQAADRFGQMSVRAESTFKSMQSTSERLGLSAESVSTSATEFKRMSARMNAPGGTLDKIAQSTEALAAASRSANTTLLPRLNRTTDEAARTVRQVGRAVEAVGDNPQSLLLGNGNALPGPGEFGFVAPPARQAILPAQ